MAPASPFVECVICFSYGVALKILGYDYPYITSLLPNETIEVHSIENQVIQQVVSAPMSGEHGQRKRLTASVHGYLVPSTEKSSKMRTVPVSLLRGGVSQ